MSKYNINKEHRDVLVNWYMSGASIKTCLAHKLSKMYDIKDHSEFVHFVLTPSILKGM